MAPEPAGPALTHDDFLGGRIKITQPKSGYRAGMDAIMMAAAVPARPGQRLLELGSGVGTAALAVAARVPGCEIQGIEIDPHLARLANANAVANQLAHQVQVSQGDAGAVKEWGLFDHSFANPPFFDPQTIDLPQDPGRARAHAADPADLDRWIDLMLRRTAPKGSLTLIFPPAGLSRILAGFGAKAGSVVICPLWPGPGKAAKRLLVRAVKGGRGALKLAPGLVLHAADGAFSAAAQAVLRDGWGFDPESGQAIAP